MKKRAKRVRRTAEPLPAFTSYTKHFFAVTFLVLAALSLYISSPFLSSIILGAVAAYTFYPAFRFVLKWVKGPRTSAILLSCILVIAALIPVVLLADKLAVQTSAVYNTVRKQMRSDDPLGLKCSAESENFVCSFANEFGMFLRNPDVRVYVTEFLNALSEFVGKAATAAILSLPKLLLGALVTLLTMYYLFVEGPSFVERFRVMLPFHAGHKQEIFKQADDVLYGVIYGSLVIIFLQGATASLTFWLVGSSQPVFWGVVMALLALLPLIGTWIVWLPMGLSFIGAGNVAGDSVLVWKGVAVIAYGLFISLPLDAVVKPFVMGARSSVHPLLIFVGVLGGLAVFGFVGVFVGPVVLTMLSVFLKIWEEERRHHKEV